MNGGGHQASSASSELIADAKSLRINYVSVCAYVCKPVSVCTSNFFYCSVLSCSVCHYYNDC